VTKSRRRELNPNDPKSWAPKRSPRGGNPAFDGVELEPGTQWFRKQWEALVAAGETDLGWSAWAREMGIVVVANHGWDDFRPGRSTLLPMSAVERPFEDSNSPGATREVMMHKISPAEPGRRRPLRKRHKRRAPKGPA
jgi:hypothetical protein